MADSVAGLRYGEFPASNNLSEYVLGFWEFHVTELGDRPYDHHVPPDGCVSIAVRYSPEASGPALLLVGPRVEAMEVQIRQPEQYFGIRFRPHGFRPLFHVNVQDLCGQVGFSEFAIPEFTLELRQLLPARPIRDQVFSSFEQTLLNLLPSAEATDETVSKAVRGLIESSGRLSIAALSDQIGISTRHLQRRFRAETGLTPKQFARVRRLREAVAHLLNDKPRSQVDLACEYGFADQAHMSREFSQLIGLTSHDFQKCLREIEHENVDP